MNSLCHVVILASDSHLLLGRRRQRILLSYNLMAYAIERVAHQLSCPHGFQS